MTTPAFPLITLEGPPLQRGRQYGEQARDRILHSIELYSKRLAGLGLSSGDLDDLAERFLPIVDAFDPEFSEEMRGIAETAGVRFAQILMINARTEMLALARRRQAAQAEHQGDGCTGVVVLPERSATGKLIHAQNWDWMAECANTSVLLKVTPDKGPAFMTFTEAGGLARSGFNSAGISITANYLECERDFKQDGVPLALIRRKVLRQEHLAHAMRAVAVTGKSASNNMIVAHRDGFAVSHECAPDQTFNVLPENDLIVHANHWISPSALAHLRDMSAGNWSDSFYRDWRVRRVLEARGQALTTEDVKAALDDRFGYPYSVCRPPHLTQRGHVSATVATILMVPAEGRLELCPLPEQGNPFAVHQLELA